MEIALYIIMAVVSAALMTALAHKLIQILQLSSYRAKGVLTWTRAAKFDYPIRYAVLTLLSVASTVTFWMAFGEYGFAGYFGFLCFAGFAIAFIIITARQKNKTPLRVTPRVKRLFAVLSIVNLAVAGGLIWLSTLANISYLLISGAPLLVYLTVLAAHYIALPFESLNNRRYYRRAQAKLASRPNLIKVGITGSYGKTTVKNILAAMLAPKYNVCFSPASFNTPMGIAKVVNYELTNEHEVLIAEMGARRIGDIKELCRLVVPNISMLTAIGMAHLDTFGSRDNIAKGKYEIIEYMAEGGLAVFNAEGGAIAPLIDKTGGRKAVSGAKGIGVDCIYDSLKFGPEGCEFELHIGGESAPVKTRLLGKHIPSLIAMCAAAAHSLNVPLADIAAACAGLEPIPHRLQLIKNGNTSILDDAYNSNPDGAAAALEMLSHFEGIKIIVTPGIVEMGADEEAVNTELGRQIAKVGGYAILVGGAGAARIEHIAAGCSEGGMADDNIIKVNSLNEATAKLAQIEPSAQRAVLFENDLPDNL